MGATKFNTHHMEKLITNHYSSVVPGDAKEKELMISEEG